MKDFMQKESWWPAQKEKEKELVLGGRKPQYGLSIFTISSPESKENVEEMIKSGKI